MEQLREGWGISSIGRYGYFLELHGEHSCIGGYHSFFAIKSLPLSQGLLDIALETSGCLRDDIAEDQNTENNLMGQRPKSGTISLLCEISSA